MEVMEAIRGRRSIGKMKSEPVSQQTIEQLLEAAAWAPNHHHTEPWRFFVMRGDGRRPLGRTMADISREKMSDSLSEEEKRQLAKMESKAFRAPVVIAVAAVPSEAQQVIAEEEYSAAAAAIQNMLLAAHDLGLGAIWRTGASMYHPKMKRLFRLADQARIIGLVYVGYPETPQTAGKRMPYAEKTVWLDNDNSE